MWERMNVNGCECGYITRFMCTHQIFILSLSCQMLIHAHPHRRQRFFFLLLLLLLLCGYVCCVTCHCFYLQTNEIINTKYAPRVFSITMTTLNALVTMVLNVASSSAVAAALLFLFFLKLLSVVVVIIIATTGSCIPMACVSLAHISFMSWHNSVGILWLPTEYAYYNKFAWIHPWSGGNGKCLCFWACAKSCHCFRTIGMNCIRLRTRSTTNTNAHTHSVGCSFIRSQQQQQQQKQNIAKQMDWQAIFKSNKFATWIVGASAHCACVHYRKTNGRSGLRWETMYHSKRD